MLKLNWHENHYIAELSGNVTISDTLKLYDELVSTDRLDHVSYGIVDCRKMENLQYQEKDYDKQAAYARATRHIHGKNYRVAIIVSSEDSEIAISKFLGSVREKFPHEWERRLFHDFEEGVRWASKNLSID